MWFSVRDLLGRPHATPMMADSMVAASCSQLQCRRPVHSALGRHADSRTATLQIAALH